MPGVPKELIEYALKVDSNATPKKQRLRCFSPDKQEAIKKELAKLLAAGFIKEVYHPEWLANPILVQKKNNNEWRMCVDYTDLNKHCPKDPFGLPHIDQVIDSTAGCTYPTVSDHTSEDTPVRPRDFFTDRRDRTAGHRFRFTGPVGPVTGLYRTNPDLNSNYSGEAKPTGIPAG